METEKKRKQKKKKKKEKKKIQECPENVRVTKTLSTYRKWNFREDPGTTLSCGKAIAATLTLCARTD